MKKVFLILFSIILLFSCATGKELEKVEATVEKIEEKSVTEEVGTEPVPLSPIVEEEEEALDLSSFPILFIDGEFIDIKDESTLELKEDQKIETPKVIGIETIEKENEQKERIEKEKNPVVYILLAVFVILALVILLIFFSSKKGKREEKEDSLWDEKEEYSSILEILSEDKNEENV
ncbi:MAG: hypothetical protein MR687_09780 [Spirochaetales bacterium]|nr:hypothetical protein [Spirochaetales bacterium]